MVGQSYKLKVIKVPLEKKAPDIKPNFSKLENLHLDLVENKKRLKPGLPPIPIPKPVIRPQPKTPSPEKEQAKPENSPPPKSILLKKAPSKKGSDDEVAKQLGEGDSDAPSELEIEGNAVSSDAASTDSESDDGSEAESSPSPSPAKPSKKEENYEPEQPAATAAPQLSPEEQEREDITEYRVKLRLLKRQYPKYVIPDFGDHTPLPELKSIYKESYRECTTDENIDWYKKILYGSWVGIEFLAVKLLKIQSFAGFAQYQMQKKEKYERMLIELGEKSHLDFMNNFPVEVRLAGLIVFDALVFFLGKLIMSYAGEEIAQSLFDMFGIPLPKVAKKPTSSGPKMRGPSISPSQIRNKAGGQK